MLRIFIKRRQRFCRISPSPCMSLTFLQNMNLIFANCKATFAKENKEIIGRLLDATFEGVKVKTSRKQINETSAVSALAVLKNYGYTDGQILQNNDVFMMAPSAIENYIEIMKESCFSSIELKRVVNFRTMHKQPIKVLTEKNIVPAYPEVVHSYSALLGLGKKAEDNLWNSLPTNIDRLRLAELRKQVICHYLTEKLQTDISEVSRLIMTYPRLDYRCLKWIKSNLSILTVDAALSRDKILKHGYLIHANPHNMLEILQKVTSLSGLPIKEMVNLRPKILTSVSSSLKEIESLFELHQISAEAVLKYPEIYTLSAMTLKQRLEDLDRIPEFKALKTHHRVVRLLYYQNKAKARVEYLKTQELSGASLHLLSSDTKRFKKLTAHGGMKTKGSDIVSYLGAYLGVEKDSKDLRKNLMRHPHWLHVPLVNVKESLQFLSSLNVFSKDQIKSALPILLYPKVKIEAEFERVINSGEAQLIDQYFLHIVLYFLEKSVHFSGDGIWLTQAASKVDDDDQINGEDNDLIELHQNEESHRDQK